MEDSDENITVSEGYFAFTTDATLNDPGTITGTVIAVNDNTQGPAIGDRVVVDEEKAANTQIEDTLIAPVIAIMGNLGPKE